jgi:hypothetical protein
MIRTRDTSAGKNVLNITVNTSGFFSVPDLYELNIRNKRKYVGKVYITASRTCPRLTGRTPENQGASRYSQIKALILFGPGPRSKPYPKGRMIAAISRRMKMIDAAFWLD